MDLETKYSKLKQKYKLLKKEHKALKNSYELLESSRARDISQIETLKSQVDELSPNKNFYKNSNASSPFVKSSDMSLNSSAEKVGRIPNVSEKRTMIQKVEENLKSPYGKGSMGYIGNYVSLTPKNENGLSILSPKPKKKGFNTSQKRSPSFSSGKTPQVNPDQSLNIEQGNAYNYQAFFVVGYGKDDGGSICECPKVLFSYINDSESISKAMEDIVPELCFPVGAETRKLKLSGSASDLNNVLYSQVPSKRNNSCFVFTLRAEEGTGEPPHPDLPNTDQEVLYFSCIRINDLCVDNQSTEWVVPKAYVLASYIPAFDMHFEFLSSLLLIKRLHRWNIIASEDNSKGIEQLVSHECCDDEISQLDAYSKSEIIGPSSIIEFGIESIELIKFLCPQDLSTIDLVWLAVPLFTSLSFYDFFFILAAILQEKSVVFISSNIGLLGSCVLGITALIRPFKWPNLIVPIVPNSLREVLDAPIPLIAGIPNITNQERQNYSNIIWVLLDEPKSDRKVQGSSSIVQEVAELEVTQLKQCLFELYKVFDGDSSRLTATTEEKQNCLKIAKELKKFFIKIINAFKGETITEASLTKVLVTYFALYDHKFIRAFSQTLVFQNKLQELSQLSR